MNFYEDTVYTDDELIRRVWAKEKIKTLMARRAYYYANDQRRRELDELWVRSPEHRRTASYGRNWGYYVGMDAIAQYYVLDHTEKEYAVLKEIHAANPEVSVDDRNLGYGCTAFHTVTTPLIYLSRDGQTGRGLWYAAGQETMGTPDGRADAWWTMDTMSADFVLEDGQWRLWHLVVCNDFIVRAGENFQDGPVDETPGSDPFRAEFGTPTIPMTVHNPRYCWSDNYPPMPMPYAYYQEAGSLSPEGHPNYREATGK